MTSLDRRALLLRSGAAALVAGPFSGLAARAAWAVPPRQLGSYGSLVPVPDKRDGVVRLHLPTGFAYRSFDHVGGRLTDGTPIPPNSDGMAAFPWTNGDVLLVRNHEVGGSTGAMGLRDRAYDPMTPGGTTSVVVSPRGVVRTSWVSLNGTLRNCSGGPTPWGTWLSCEETVNGPDVGNDRSGTDNSRLERKHGYVFEVPVGGYVKGRPIRKAGRFAHESVAYAPVDGHLYLTEDNYAYPSGFYRYRAPEDPATVGYVGDGGRLQMLAVKGDGNANLAVGQPRGVTYPCTWVDIPDPDPAFSTWSAKPSNATAGQYVGRQGRDAGAAVFSRLEGAIHYGGVVYFTSTQGGARDTSAPAPPGFGDGRGQVWGYDTRTSTLRLVYESTSLTRLDLPDNVTASANGTLVLCEDGGGASYLRGLTRDGLVFDFARNAVPGYQSEEFAGSTFAGQTLFVNIQSTRAMTFAIWGPWHRTGFGPQPVEFAAV